MGTTGSMTPWLRVATRARRRQHDSCSQMQRQTERPLGDVEGFGGERTEDVADGGQRREGMHAGRARSRMAGWTSCAQCQS